LNVRLTQLLDWLRARPVDIVCLQETKTDDAAFPAHELEHAGYASLFSGQRAYNGVAILARGAAPSEVATSIPGFADEQKRVLAATLDGLRVICLYVPNGESIESDKYRHKLRWLEALHGWVGDEIKRYPNLALLGDFNIAPEPRDVYDPKLWEGRVLFSVPEREAFQRLLALGLKDSFRLFEQPDRSYSWWDYRLNAFKRNLGLRIDHILVSASFAGRVRGGTIDKTLRALERPSDHAPVVIEVE
jgi:exodeoxyribonuclease-3